MSAVCLQCLVAGCCIDLYVTQLNINVGHYHIESSQPPRPACVPGLQLVHTAAPMASSLLLWHAYVSMPIRIKSAFYKIPLASATPIRHMNTISLNMQIRPVRS